MNYPLAKPGSALAGLLSGACGSAMALAVFSITSNLVLAILGGLAVIIAAYSYLTIDSGR